MAEDNPEDVYLINESLREAGVQARIQVVSDGESAIRHVVQAEDRPALVLLDAHLPKKNGIEVLEAIRASDAGREIPIVIFSSEISELEQSRAHGLGVSAYLSKSSDLAEFNRIGPIIKQLLMQAATKGQSTDS